MQFISTMKQQSYTLELANTEVKQTNVGNVVVPHMGRRVVFSPLMEAFKSPHLTANGGEAWGILDTEHQSKDTGIPEDDIIKYLMKHKDYGVRIVGIGHDGSEIIGEDQYIELEGQGGYYCSLCKKHLQNVQGKSNHIKSGGHLEQVEFANAAALANVV